MAVFHCILLATDGSPAAVQALAYARDLAILNGAQVVVVHSYPPIPGYLGSPQREERIAEHAAEGERVVAPAADQLRKAGVSTTAEVLEGPPAQAILSVAQARQCDLIVMGSRGHGALSGVLLGSVSRRVLDHAAVPVLTVRAAEQDS